MRRAHFAWCVLVAAGCGAGIHYAVPRRPWARDARFGFLGGSGPAPSRAALCRDWQAAVEDRDPHATSHDSYPETDPARACFTFVDHGPRGVRVGPAPQGCGFPVADGAERLERLASELRARPDGAIARGLFECELTPADRRAAIEHNAGALTHLAARARAGAPAPAPYTAVVIPGYGASEQRETSLVGWRPGDPCLPLSTADQERLGVNVVRAVRGAAALRGGVAPVIIVSGGAVHSPVVEAFALAHLLQCTLPVRADEILLEPCARHTHTNLRNAGRWIVAMGGRAAYVLTDDGLQDDYLQEWSGFEMIAGSLDRRSLRDWGTLLGSWRQASRGIDSGFWYTPYRFWAEPRDGLGSWTCVQP